MSDSKRDPSVVAAGCLIVLVSIPLSVVMRGWALSKLWVWFITYHFHIDSPGMIGCLGLSLVLSFFLDSLTRKGKPSGDGALGSDLLVLANAVLSPLLAVFIGWVLVYFREAGY